VQEKLYLVGALFGGPKIFKLMRSIKMKKFSDRYKTISVHLTHQEWELLNEEHEEVCSSTGYDISKHKFLKLLINNALDKGKSKSLVISR
tara:strand:- start:1957 stop:2226 length:270 start_codon:yes stop_codon:yes gene_type:complete